MTDATFPILIPTPHGGAVALANARDKRSYDVWGYSAARRAGDTIYISGHIIARPADQAPSEAVFAAQCTAALEAIAAQLAAFGAGFADVAMINSFHIWDSPDFPGDRYAQARVFQTALRQVMQPPWPAWTAVGTTGLLAERAILEVQMIAHHPAA